MTEKELIEKVKENPDFIKEIENPSEEVQLAAVRQDGYAIKYIKNPSEVVQLAALEYEAETLEFVEKPTNKVQLKAVEDDPYNLACFKDPIFEAVVNAIEADAEILDSLEYWLDDEEIPLDRSSEGLEEGLRRYASNLLETGEIEMLFNFCRALSNIEKKKISVTTPAGITVEEPIYTSLVDILIHFLTKVAEESGDDYYHFEDMYNYLVNDLDIFESMLEHNGVETLIKKCNSDGVYGSISPDYRYATVIAKIDFAAQDVAERLQSLEESIEQNEIIDYCILKFNEDLFLVTFEYAE